MRFGAEVWYRLGVENEIRRPALSIALNIAEGNGADSDAEFKRFLN